MLRGSEAAYDPLVGGARRGLIDAGLARFVQGGVSAMLATVDDTAFPDVTRVNGLAALDDRRIRAVIASDALTARANAVTGARVALLVTDIVSYRSLMFRGTVLVASAVRTPGDLALVDHHVSAFVTAAPEVGMDPAMAERFFAVDVVPLVLEVDSLVDKTPGPTAGRTIVAPP